MSTETVQYATKEDLAERLAEVGVDLGSVVSGHGSPRIDVVHLAGGSELVLVVTTYALNSEGFRYIDPDTLNDDDGPKAATETRRFLVTSDWRFVPTSGLYELSNGRLVRTGAGDGKPSI